MNRIFKTNADWQVKSANQCRQLLCVCQSISEQKRVSLKALMCWRIKWKAANTSAFYLL